MKYTAETTLRKIHSGKDGQSEYIHIMYAYSDNPPTPSDMSPYPYDCTYMGVCISTSSVAPNTPSSYQWSKIQGDPGEKGATGLPGKDGTDGISSYIHIKFSDDGGTSFTSNEGETPGAWIGIYTDADPVDSTIIEKYTWTKIVGEKGTDSTSIILTNETHTFQGGDNEVLPASTSSDVIAHTGTMQVPVSIGTPTLPSGMTFTIHDNNTVNAGFTVSIDETLQQRSGSISIPITISGMEFTKDFSWTVAMRGEKGDEAAICTVSGDQVFKYLSDATAPTEESLILSAEYRNATHKEWQYKNGSGTWTAFSPAETGLTLSVSPTDSCWNNGNTAVVRAIDTTETVYDSMTLVKVRDGNTGEAAITGLLSNDSHRIPTDGDGNNGDYTGASTTMSVFQGTTDISDTFTYTAVASNGVTGSLSGGTYTVTSMTTDTGYVDITAKRTGYPDVTKRFNLSLGKSATAYWLVTNATVIFKDDAGIDPTTITMTGKCKSGDSSIMDYAARFEVYHDDDLVYSSTVDESSYTYTIPTDTTSIRVVMKEAGGTGVVLDEQNIPVVTDGRPGYDGYTVFLTNQNESFPCDADGNIPSDIATSTTVIAYKGVEEITAIIGTLPTVPGLQLSTVSDSSGNSMIMIVAKAGTALAQNGSLEIPLTVDGKPFTAVFSWTKLMDATGLKEEVETIKETSFMVGKDKQEITAFIQNTTIAKTEEGDDVSISDLYTEWKADINGITQTVSSIETDFDNQITSMQTQITQTSNKLSLIATSEEGSSSIVLTPDFISLVSEGINFDGVLSFYNSVATGTNKTEINGDKITTGIIKSANYSAPTETSSPYSVAGTALDLSNGFFYSPYFTIDGDGAHFNGDGTFEGIIHATGGSFDGDITANGTVTGGTFVGGVMRSANYSYSSGNFSTNGMEINLSEGTIRTKNTFLSSDGVLYTNGIQATNGTFTGTVNATNGSFSGSITSTSGTIGGFTIGANALYNGTSSMSSGSNGVYLGTDGINVGGGWFKVTSSGNVTCQSIDINGGTIDIGSNFHVSSDGSVSANNGSFTGDVDAHSLKVQDKIIIYGENEDTQLTFGDYTYTESVEGLDGSYRASYKTRVGIINDDHILDSYLSFGVETTSGGSSASHHSYIEYNATEHNFNSTINGDAINGTNIRASSGLWLATGGNSITGYTYTNIEDLFASSSHTHSEYARPTTLYYGSSQRVTANNASLTPYLDDTVYLGTSDYRWSAVNARNGAIQTSDFNEKTNINYIDDRYEKAYMEFEPILYMWKNFTEYDNHDRIHTGFIAQQIEEVCQKYNLSAESFAAICKDNLEEPTEDGRTVRYGLNYSQFVALNTHMIQKLYKTIDAMQEKIDSLENKLSQYAS